MSEQDSFMREVTEEVRRDRMFRLWKKYGPWVIALIVLIIAGAALMSWLDHRAREQARATGGAFLAAEITSVEDQEALLERVEGPPELVARLRLAAARAEAGQREQAAALYREIAGTPDLHPAYADLARLEAVRLGLGSMAPEEATAELEPLLAEGAPYRLLALELRAVARLNAGEAEAAHEDLHTIIGDPGATRALTERAAAMLLSSGGELPEMGRS